MLSPELGCGYAGGNQNAPCAILLSVGRRTTEEVPSNMSDYVKSRPAKVGEKLITQHFHPGRVGFASPQDASTAVRVFSGTELAFATAIKCNPRGLFGWKMILVNHTMATFGKSIRTTRERMMMRWNCPTDEWCC